VNQTDADDTNGVHRACEQGNAKCLRLLIENKADLDCKAQDGDTGLIVAARNGHSECLKVMIEANADMDCKNNHGDTGLILAAYHGNSECLKVMIEANADVNQTDADDLNVVYWACQEGNAECLRLLIENDADGFQNCFNDEDGNTLLILAVQKDFPKCVKVLLEAKADVDCENKEGRTAFTVAFEWSHFSCLMVLLDNGGGGTPVSADTKTQALSAVLKSEGEFSASEQAAAFMLLAHGTDIDVAAEDTSKKRLRLASSMYEHCHRFIERWHGVALNAMSTRVEVDRRVGVRLNGLYQEPLERVLQYLGLSMDADQVVNISMDDDHNVRRVLLPNCARNANHWFQLFQQHQ
jgi:hypothetical protein